MLKKSYQGIIKGMDTQIQITTQPSISPQNITSQPYPPSFIDRMMDVVQRLPVPYGLTYLVLAILLVIFNHIVGWVDGWLPAYTFSSVTLLVPLWLCGPLAIITYLDSVSHKALSDFGPLLDVPDETMRQLKYEFTTMPQRAVILSTALWGIFFLLLTYLASETFWMALGMGQFAIGFYFVEGFVTFLIGGVIYYHSIRQLRLVDKTVKLVKHFNLFRLEPVYAFSAVTSRTAIAWALLLTLTLVVFPIQLAPIPTLSFLIVQVLFAMAAFVLPLRIVNQRLVAEKRRLLSENEQRIETTLAQLHSSIDEKTMANPAELHAAISGLNVERSILEKIPTWPWRAGMLTGFLSIVVLPIIIFLIQLMLGNWLAP